ncbi:isopentenyldiphosphate isomerase [Bacillus tianshenii]|uniref:Isopentenyldiphosphate isomerase n=1 Tax=Sutcliffiella tianshenii TaxID=1463404 RepID=A0ABS2NX16_9BACI|nr:NUDIX domain-containing protein [Bacillus tianshenii]MBM7619177.1 isopentenyldiphosphate isomerase [Bacillus tianshenii]
MESEKLRIFDEKGKFVGVETRREVHKKGYWHETFHFWLVERVEGVEYIYFQLRSEHKKDYPDLLDITAAGHILATETVEDGIREVKEEIGIDVSMEELHSLGVIPYTNVHHDLIDRELAHVFLLVRKYDMEDFLLQPEEVSGMARIKLDDMILMWEGKLEQVEATGFKMDSDGERAEWNEPLKKEHFVQHEDHFYLKTFARIKKALEESSD